VENKERKIIRKNTITGMAHIISYEQYRHEAIYGHTPGDIYIEKRTGKQLPAHLHWNSARKIWQ